MMRIILFVSILALCACKQSLTPKEFELWCNDETNGMIKSKEIGPYKFQIKYQPHNSDETTQSFVFRIDSKIGGTSVMQLGNTSDDDYYKKIEYFSFGIQNDLNLIEGSDTLKCVQSHFEYLHNLTPYCDFVLLFDKSKTNEIRNKTIVFNASKLGVGYIKLVIDSKNLENIPELL